MYQDDAEEVREKIRANFCDYFKLGDDTFDPAAVAAEERARDSLGSLFGGASDDDGQDHGEDHSDGDGDLSDAEDLFR